MKWVRWSFHWLGQGLKLLLFEAVAGLFTVPLLLPLWLLEEYGSKLHRLGRGGEIIDIGLRLILCGIGLAIFTAALAAQLKDFPLVGPEPREETDGEKA